MLAVGCDIGGHHISATPVDLNERRPVGGEVEYRELNRKASAEALFAGWSDAIIAAMAQIGPEQCSGIGIAMPGPFNYRTGEALFETNDKFEALNGVNVRTELSRLLPADMPIRFINDAAAFALGAIGAAGLEGREKRVLAITLGTGFGSCFLADGLPMVDDTMPGVPPGGALWDMPYKDGIADDYISSRWFVREYHKRFGKDAPGVAEIAKAARANDDVRAIFNDFGANLAEIIAPWLSRFNARQIVMGGRITGAMDLFGPPLEEGLRQHGAESRIHIHETTEDAAMLGAAMTIDNSFWNRLEPVLPDR